jgi:hypothetical protein
VKNLSLFLQNETVAEFKLYNEAIAQELCKNPMGKMMLGKIAAIYIEQGHQHLGGFKAMEASVGEVTGRWGAKIDVAKSMYSTYKAAKKMEKN